MYLIEIQIQMQIMDRRYSSNSYSIFIGHRLTVAFTLQNINNYS